MTAEYEIRLIELGEELLKASEFLSWNNADECKLKERITFISGYISALKE